MTPYRAGGLVPRTVGQRCGRSVRQTFRQTNLRSQTAQLAGAAHPLPHTQRRLRTRATTQSADVSPVHDNGSHLSLLLRMSECARRLGAVGRGPDDLSAPVWSSGDLP